MVGIILAKGCCSELLWLDMEHKMAGTTVVFHAHQDVINISPAPRQSAHK